MDLRGNIAAKLCDWRTSAYSLCPVDVLSEEKVLLVQLSFLRWPVLFRAKSIAVLFPNFLFFTLCDGSLPVRWGFSVMAEGAAEFPATSR